MTTTTTTPSEPTGIRPIDIDIIKDRYGSRATITSFTDAGARWLMRHMTHVQTVLGICVVRVDADCIDDLIESMTEARLKVALK